MGRTAASGSRGAVREPHRPQHMVRGLVVSAAPRKLKSDSSSAAMNSRGYSLSDRGERTRVDVGGVQLRPCGTTAGLQRHRSAGEEPCAACREAARRYRRYKKADNEYHRMLAAGASGAELGEVNQRRFDLELEYRSLERRTDTPQPASRRWKVYRFSFVNGLQYVGITRRTVSAREAEHVSGDEGLRGGSARISELVAAGVNYKLETLAMNLVESEAYEKESKEIAKLKKPLNVKGPIRPRPTAD